MFNKILIANRGEIAVRIIRACKEMGILTVSVFSEADRDALHVSLADESYCIGPAKVADSYLNMGAILSVAVASGAEAVHPGYGLLSENAKFAELCAQCNLVFIGPPAEVIARMGDKEAARRTMIEAGVPVIPGCDLVETVEEAKRQAERIGYPLLIKARAGGGGRGIRMVKGPDQVEEAFQNASFEARNAFGDGAVYMEKYLKPVKHVEMQLLCDHSGSVVCLGERDCSVQRKNQKLIEESPCVALKPDVRQKMMEAAVLAAKTVHYTNLGTIEFLLDRQDNFYFMEMNTRLQVEHPVTEYVTGIDVVKWQIRIAAGMEFSSRQEDIRLRGCAIECRINSEDARNNFRPSCGKIALLHIPGGPWVRFDTAIYQDYQIPPYYDSMIGKLIVYAHDRTEAIRKMQAALCELVIEGVHTNAELSSDILAQPEFKDGSYCTNFLDKFLKNYH